MLNVPNVFIDACIAAHYWFRAHGFQSAPLAPIMFDDTLLAVLTMMRAEPFHLDVDDQYVMDHEKAGMLGIDAFLMKQLVLHDLGLAIQRVLASHRILL
jgi:hypothetical protein